MPLTAHRILGAAVTLAFTIGCPGGGRIAQPAPQTIVAKEPAVPAQAMQEDLVQTPLSAQPFVEALKSGYAEYRRSGYRGTVVFDESKFEPPARVWMEEWLGEIVTLHNPNETPEDIEVSRNTVLSQLVDRKGPVFDRLAHVAHMVSSPFPQDSSILEADSDGSHVVAIGRPVYRLSFERLGQKLRLVRVDYLVQEVE